MQIPFHKYQGTGNDFILIDNREQFFDKNAQQIIEKLCHRRLGIGADGLILLENSNEADFYMRYYNSDGNEATMCG
ncbi:MAG: diaminopimelate epimerase, partial [Flavobacteriaceae bacterium]|nr:diaminopimelate epimerase [Flavobacteriaceae bacterium]